MNLTCKAYEKGNQILLIYTAYIAITGILYFIGITPLIQGMILVGMALVIMTHQQFYPYILIFLIVNRALFREVGFEYLYNVAILLMVLKKLILSRENLKIDRKCFGYVVVAILIGIVDMLWFDTLTISALVSFISWGVALLFMLLYLDNYKAIDTYMLYKFMAYGLVAGCICEVMVLKYQYNFVIPYYNFRFSGLFRETNSYGVACLILAMTSLSLNKIQEWKREVLFLLFAGLGFLSLSKAYILIFSFSLILIIIKRNIHSIRWMKKEQIFLRIGGLCIGVLGILFVLRNDIFENQTGFLYSYMDRFEQGDLTSGRLTLWIHYLKHFWDSIYGMIFGYGINYIDVPGFAPDLGQAGKTYETHCTYMDVFVSFGLIGGVIFVCLLVRLFVLIRNESLKYSWANKCKEDMPFIIFLIGIFPLSFLNGDYFIILFCTVIALSKRKRNVGNSNEEIVYM